VRRHHVAKALSQWFRRKAAPNGDKDGIITRNRADDLRQFRLIQSERNEVR
jgi:hypothetical protein